MSLRHRWLLLKCRMMVKPCNDWSCRSAQPGHDSHLTRLGRWYYSERFL